MARTGGRTRTKMGAKTGAAATSSYDRARMDRVERRIAALQAVAEMAQTAMALPEGSRARRAAEVRAEAMLTVLQTTPL